MILLFQNMLLNSFCIFLDTDENKNKSLEENHSNSLLESSNSKKKQTYQN